MFDGCSLPGIWHLSYLVCIIFIPSLQVKSAVENQYAQCETLLKSCHDCKTQAGAKKNEIHNLKSDLVKTRKTIAVELDEMFW